MPIKFACEHCGQVLSVSSTKSGKPAKCPKCHQSITVPSAEVAAATLANRKKRELSKPVAHERHAPAPPEAGPLAPPPPPLVGAEKAAGLHEPAPPEHAVESRPSAASEKTPPPLDEPADEGEGTDDPFSQFVVYDDGAELVYAADAEDAYEHESEIDPDALAVPRGVLYLQGALLIAVALVCFVLGVLVGGATRGGKAAGPRVAQPCQIAGTVVFRDRRKEAVPDDGCVVIVLPQDARPDQKSEVLGLRPEDPTPDQDHASLAAIRSLGGDYARTDVQGKFRLRVADTGPYFVLLISRNSKRKPGETLKTADLAQLGRYFTDAVDLIGENRYRWKVERFSGDRLLSEEFN